MELEQNKIGGASNQEQSAETPSLSSASFPSSYGRKLLLSSIGAVFGMSAIGTQSGCSNSELLRQGSSALVGEQTVHDHKEASWADAKVAEKTPKETAPTAASPVTPPPDETPKLPDTRTIQHTIIPKGGNAATVVTIQNVPNAWFEPEAKPNLNILVGRALDIGPATNQDEALKTRIEKVKNAFGTAKTAAEIRTLLGKIIDEDFNPPKIPEPVPDAIG